MTTEVITNKSTDIELDYDEFELAMIQSRELIERGYPLPYEMDEYELMQKMIELRLKDRKEDE